jgi:hypothetical protein
MRLLKAINFLEISMREETTSSVGKGYPVKCSNFYVAMILLVGC